jgi:hypothetical protein
MLLLDWALSPAVKERVSPRRSSRPRGYATLVPFASFTVSSVVSSPLLSVKLQKAKE